MSILACMKRCWLVLALAAVICLTGCRSPAGQDVRLDGSRLTLTWTHETGSPINAPPLEVNGRIVVIPQNGPLLALDAATGLPVWEYAPRQGVWDTSLVVDDTRVYVGRGDATLVALDGRTGKLRWEKKLGTNVQAAPRLADGVLYVPTTTVGTGLDPTLRSRVKLFALSAADGEILWEFESDSYILQTPFLADGVLYTGGGYDSPGVKVEEGGPLKIYSVSAANGSLIWSHNSEDGHVKSLYAGGGAVAYIAYRDFTQGLDAATGEPLWRKDTGNWVPRLSGHEDVIYYGSANTVVHAVDIRTGKSLWEYNIPGGSFNYILGTPLWVQGDLVFLTQHGEIMALDAETGSLLWSVATGATARVGITVSGGQIFFGDQDGVVYAYR